MIKRLVIVFLFFPSVAFGSIQWFTSYSMSTDLQEERPQLYHHNLSFGATTEVARNWNLNGGMIINYKSKENAIVRESDQEDFFSIQDVEISLRRNFYRRSRHSFSFEVGHYVPTSEASRYEGVVGIPFIASAWNYFFIPKSLGLYLRNEEYFILNKFKYSPTSNEINPDVSSRVQLGLGYNFLNSWRVAAELRASATHYVDGTNTYETGNSQILSYKYRACTLMLKYANTGYVDKGDVDFWFYDKNRKLATFMVGFVF